MNFIGKDDSNERRPGVRFHPRVYRRRRRRRRRRRCRRWLVNHCARLSRNRFRFGDSKHFRDGTRERT